MDRGKEEEEEENEWRTSVGGEGCDDDTLQPRPSRLRRCSSAENKTCIDDSECMHPPIQVPSSSFATPSSSSCLPLLLVSCGLLLLFSPLLSPKMSGRSKEVHVLGAPITWNGRGKKEGIVTENAKHMDAVLEWDEKGGITANRKQRIEIPSFRPSMFRLGRQQIYNSLIVCSSL